MIRDYLVESHVLCNESFRTWREVIEACGSLLMKDEKVERPFVDSMIETVEELGPYMILLPKVAFFHGKPSKAVKEVCLSLVTLENTVTFDDFENQEIRCAFGFGAIDGDSHMKMLQEIVMLLQDHEFIELITNNGSKAAIMKKISQY